MASAAGLPAQAAPPRIRFHVEPERYSEALLDLAQQANVTLIGAGACQGYSHAGVQGSFTLREALDQLLTGAPCGWKMVAPGAIEVSAAPRDEAPAKPLPPTTVSELLVTATKRVRDARQLAVAVTAVPGRELQAVGAADVGDAAGQFAGVLTTNLGPGRDKLLLRGLSDGVYTGRARSTVATYLDDIPVNYNAPDPDLRLVDVERVEVARGPQGALYGAGSLSGVYRIVSNKPDLGGFSGQVRLTGALTQHGAPSDAVEGYVNMPIRGMGLRLSAYREIQGGYFDDLALGLKDVDRTLRQGGRLQVLLQPSSEWTVHLTAAAQHLRSDDTHYTGPTLGLRRVSRVQEPHVNDIALVTASVRHEWGWGELTSTTGYVRHAYGSFYDSTDTQTQYTDLAETSVYSERARTHMLVQDIFVNSRGAGRFEWLAGLYGEHTIEHAPNQFLAHNSFAPNVVVYGDDRHDRISELAAYAEGSYEFAPGWRAAVGGRLFTIRTHTHSDVVSEKFAPRTVDRDRHFTSFSPKVSLQKEFAGGDLAYLVMSEGYRAGGVNSGGALPLAAVFETYAPDRLRNYELGLKLQAFGRRLQINSAAFYDVWKDLQTDQFRPSGIPFTTNVGDAHISGLESELAVRVLDGLTVQLNGRISRTHITNANPAFAASLLTPLVANGLPGAPAVSGGGVVTYERDLFDAWRLRLAGEASYVGRSYVTFDASLPKMGGYVRSKLSAELSAGRFGVQAFVTNALNDYSDTFGFGNPFFPLTARQITPQRPRTVGVTLFAAY